MTIRKKVLGRMAAVTLAMGLVLSGCGSKTGNTEAGETTGSESGVVTPEKPAYGSGVTNLSETVEKADLPYVVMTKQCSRGLARCAFTLLQKFAEQDKGNILLGPASIQMALGMMTAGSDEGSATRKELMEFLLPGESSDPDSLNKELGSFSKRMRNDQGVSWNVANSIWVNADKKITLQDSYISDMTNRYAAELFSAPFDEATTDSINSWVKTNTADRIPEILNQLDPDSVLVLVNAMSFDGAWATAYRAPEQVLEGQDFSNADGTKSKVTMLESEEYGVLNLAGGVGFIKPYSGGTYSFVGLLPPEGMSAEKYVAKILEEGGFADAYRSASRSRKAYVTLPEFKTEYEKKMDETLQSLGVKEAYTMEAGFRKMVTDDSTPVAIGTVVHKAMIEVDRTGTKAAAATAVVATEAGIIEVTQEEPVTIRLDRPFVYAVVDEQTGVPIFMGIQNKME